MIDWSAARVLVTGGAGFLGSSVVRTLKARGAGQLFIPRSAEYDLVDGAAVRRSREPAPVLLVRSSRQAREESRGRA